MQLENKKMMKNNYEKISGDTVKNGLGFFWKILYTLKIGLR